MESRRAQNKRKIEIFTESPKYVANMNFGREGASMSLA